MNGAGVGKAETDRRNCTGATIFCSKLLFINILYHEIRHSPGSSIEFRLINSLIIYLWLNILFLTGSIKAMISLTAVSHDWTCHNLATAQLVLREASQFVLDRTDPTSDPLLDSPNLPNYRGYTRWVVVAKCFERAVQAGRFDGIHSNWIDVGGSSVLELVGANTTVTICHLQSEEDAPRESSLRRTRRQANAVQLSLFEGESQFSDRIHLILAHGGGGNSGDFADLRIYYGEENSKLCVRVSENIMLLPQLMPEFESEPVDEPSVALLPEIATQQQAGGDNS